MDGSAYVLRFCNDQIVGEGLERLKLILYPILKSEELDKLDTAYKIYEKILSIGKYDTDEKAMEIFLFAVRAIGGSERGKICAEEAKRRIPTIGELKLSSQSRKFRFFFWLLKVERRLPPTFKDDVLKHFSKAAKINHELCQGSVPRLFIYLHKRGILTESNTIDLREYIEKCRNRAEMDTPEYMALKKCISYLTNFEDEVEGEPFTSADDESTSRSVQESSDPWHERTVTGNRTRRTKKQKIENRKQGKPPLFKFDSVPSYLLHHDDITDPQETIKSKSYYSGNRSVPDGEDRSNSENSSQRDLIDSIVFLPKGDPEPSFLSVSRPQHSANNDIQHGSIGSINFTTSEELKPKHKRRGSRPTDHNPADDLLLRVHAGPNPNPQEIEKNQSDNVVVRVLKKHKLNTLVIVFTLILLVIVIAVCSVTVWSPLHKLSNSHDVQYREKSVPLLAEFNPFLVKGFHVRQEPDLDDSLHTVDVYLTNAPCSDLPVITTNHDYNNSHPPDTIPVYMLKGSVVALKVNASTTNPESNPLFFYIIRSVESDLHFDANRKDGRHGIFIGKNNVSKPTNIKLSIASSDYYTFRFTPIQLGVSLKYSLSLKIRHINLNNVSNGSQLVGTLDPYNDRETVGTKILNIATSYRCLFAEIKESAITITNNYTTLEVHVDPRLDAGVGVTISVLIIILAGFIISICFIKYKFKRQNYSKIP